MTNRTTPAQCSLAFFYASWCPFSARAAPHFNGLARLFPDMKMYAIDTSDFHTMNTQFGIMALPTLILFHNSKAVAKYNQSDFELENFAKRKLLNHFLPLWKLHALGCANSPPEATGSRGQDLAT